MARKITFVRHGQTDKVKPDSARHLTDEGKAQAARRREALGNPRFDLGIHSPMDRAHQTLEIIAGGPIMTKVVPQLLHDSGTNDGKLLDEAAEQLGYAPMKDYFEKTSLETQEALKRYGTSAWQAILKAVEDTKPDDSILIVGHAVLIPLTVYTGVDEPFKPAVAQINLGECQGIWITVDNNGTVSEMGSYCD